MRQAEQLIMIFLIIFLMAVCANAGDLEPPTEAPSPTMHTLEEIYNKIDAIATLDKALPAKTGQATSYATGDDGDLQKGVAFPNPRFTDNSDGTVTDNLTSLIWLKNANAFELRNWPTALTDCNGLATDTAGLTDGSVAGDWRLPNRFELESLIDLSQYNLCLPSGHPFTNVQSGYFWSGTTIASDAGYAWGVDMYYGSVNGNSKASNYYVWPVRGGND